MSRRFGLFLGVRIVAAATVMIAVSACDRETAAPSTTAKPQPSSTAPSTLPATEPSPSRPQRGALHPKGSSADWPAFHGGGEMRGVAAGMPNQSLKLRWTFSLDEGPAPINSAAAIAGQYAYVGDTRGRLFCLNLADGKPAWTVTTKSGFESTPLVFNGRVYAGDMDGLLYCLSADKGEKIWTYDNETGQPIHGSPNLAGDRIIYGDDGGKIICVTLDGKKAWEVAAGDRINSAPCVSNGMAYVSGCDSQLRGISISDGKQKFEMELPSIAPGSPVLVGDRLLIGTDGGNLLCVAADGSKTLWTYKDFRDQAMVYSTPAVADDIVVVGARDSHVHAISLKDGKQIWTFGTRGDVDSSPAISNGRVYVASQDKKLYVLDLKTGAKLGEYPGRFAIDASIAIGQGVIVFGDGRGNVYCYE